MIDVDSLFSQWNKSTSPGCAVGIIKNGKLIYNKGYGLSEMSHEVSVTSHTVFRVCSLAKQFTAACIELLIEQGLVNRDDKISDHLPDLPSYTHSIAVQHLIHHTSGLMDYTDIFDHAGTYDYLLNYYTAEDIWQLVSRVKRLAFPPGTRFAYSNTGYFLLTMLVKKLTGQKLPSFAEQNIFQPLDMDNTLFNADRSLIIKNRATGYKEDKTGFKLFDSHNIILGGGGLFSTIEDLAKWDANFYSNQLGNKDPSFITNLQAVGILNNGEKIDYASGLRLANYRGLNTISHSGGHAGFRAYMVRFPDQHFSVICLSNLANLATDTPCYRIADLFLKDQYVEDKKTSVEDRSSPEITETVELTGQQIQSFVGLYRSPATKVILKVHGKEGKLLVSNYDVEFLPPSVYEATDESSFRKLSGRHAGLLEFKNGKMVIRGKKRMIEIERLASYHPSIDELEEYTGSYYSAELDARYQLRVKNGHLDIFVNRRKETIKLLPVQKDDFAMLQVYYSFTRDSKGKISGLVMNSSGITDIEFKKAS